MNLSSFVILLGFSRTPQGRKVSSRSLILTLIELLCTRILRPLTGLALLLFLLSFFLGTANLGLEDYAVDGVPLRDRPARSPAAFGEVGVVAAREEALEVRGAERSPSLGAEPPAAGVAEATVRVLEEAGRGRDLTAG